MTIPSDLDEALALIEEEPGVWRPFAGGTDLMVLLEAGKLDHRRFFSIRHLEELRGIDESDEFVTVGALTSYTDVLRSEIMRREYPLLCGAARETGGVAIQNRGTLGGNIANASPAADSPPALIAYGASLELVSRKGARWVEYDAFHTGYKKTIMRDDELLSRIRLPRLRGGAKQVYKKVGTRRAQAISKVCFAGIIEMTDGVVTKARLSFGSVAPTVLRCRRAEAALRGRALNDESVRDALAGLSGELAPIDDLRSTARFRARVAQNLLRDFLTA